MSSALASAQHQALRSPPPPGLGVGLRAFFGGFGYVITTPGAWPLALVPVTAALVLTSLFVWGALGFVPGYVGELFPPASGVLGSAVRVAAQVAAAVGAAVVAALAGFGLAQPLSSPALERLARRRLLELGATPSAPSTFFQDLARSVGTVLVGYALGLPILALLFIVSALFPPASVVTIPLKILVSALVIAWDVGDPALSVRGYTIDARVAFVRRHTRALLGFGLGFALLSLLPCAMLLALPAGVAGAARLVHELELHDGASAPRAE